MVNRDYTRSGTGCFLYWVILFIFSIHSGPENLKKSSQKKTREIKYIEKFFRETACLAVFETFSQFSKIDFWPFLKLQKNGFWSKKIFHEIDFFHSKSFFGLDFFKFSGRIVDIYIFNPRQGILSSRYYLVLITVYRGRHYMSISKVVCF